MCIFRIWAQRNYCSGRIFKCRYYDEDNFYAIELVSGDKNSINLVKKY